VTGLLLRVVRHERVAILRHWHALHWVLHRARTGRNAHRGGFGRAGLTQLPPRKVTADPRYGRTISAFAMRVISWFSRSVPRPAQNRVDLGFHTRDFRVPSDYGFTVSSS
jgi:hypothetical protein